MAIFYQPVELPKRCFLQEVLYWIAFQRLPIASYFVDGIEVRENLEMGYVAEGSESELSEEETRRAGIPPDPHWRRLFAEDYLSSSERYAKLLEDHDLDSDLRAKWSNEYKAALAFEEECQRWQPHFERVTELARSKIYVALKEGRLSAQGRLLPVLDLDEATTILDEQGQAIVDIEPSNIPPSFWAIKTIDFEVSAATNETNHYCHITCVTEDMLRVFPGDRRTVAGVGMIADTLIVDGQPSAIIPGRNRGRPPYPWEGFHIEVADLFRRSQMPAKKEAAIEYFRQWFQREHGVCPSRAAVGEKLKPYFDKLVTSTRQKT